MNDGFGSISTRTVDSCRDGDLRMAFVMDFMQRWFVAWAWMNWAAAGVQLDVEWLLAWQG
jgi:hypothetical protein